MSLPLRLLLLFFLIDLKDDFKLLTLFYIYKYIIIDLYIKNITVLDLILSRFTLSLCVSFSI